jgi:hypothetical protein
MPSSPTELLAGQICASAVAQATTIANTAQSAPDLDMIVM